MKVLVAEDDLNTRKGLIEILNNEGYEVLEASNGNEAIELFNSQNPDFICLDIMMPEKSGYDVCKAIRARDQEVPIIFISAKSEEVDKVVGLELGADDYILKPFGVKEVVARIRAVTRRCYRKQIDELSSFRMGDIEISPRELRGQRGEEAIEFSLREIRLLEFFYKNKGKALDRDQILNECWGVNYFPNSRTLDQHISVLRKKIEFDPKKPEIIQTVHGTGYSYRG